MNQFDYTLRIEELKRTKSNVKKVKLAKIVYSEDIFNHLNFVSGTARPTKVYSTYGLAIEFILKVDKEVPDTIPDYILSVTHYLKKKYEPTIPVQNPCR